MRNVAARFGQDDAGRCCRRGTQRDGRAPVRRIAAFARDADVLVNISGILTDEDLMAPRAVKVYLDLDPAFNQLWHAQGIDMHFGGHDRFVTVGQAIGTPASRCPRAASTGSRRSRRS